jgi:succinate dehydrogenase hydrophobic anchor subunit
LLSQLRQGRLAKGQNNSGRRHFLLFPGSRSICRSFRFFRALSGLILAPLLLWPHLFAGIFVTEQEAMGHKAVDSFQEHALKVFGFAMFVAKLLSHDGLRKARSLQQRQAMNKE